MFIVKTFDSFNFRRYSNPWIAKLDKATLKPDFSEKVGGYTGGYNRGEAGSLYLLKPEELTIYMYGQKDYRGNNTTREYCIYYDGYLYKIPSCDLPLYCSDDFNPKSLREDDIING